MGRQYGSFLVRYWVLYGGEARVDVEHIQSGRCVRLDSTHGALDWMQAQVSQAAQPRGENLWVIVDVDGQYSHKEVSR